MSSRDRSQLRVTALTVLLTYSLFALALLVLSCLPRCAGWPYG